MKANLCGVYFSIYGKLEALLLPGGNTAHGQSDKQQASFKLTVNAEINATE